ncbi:hypothetical protein C8J56DRAFT_1121616 [Mycena floridula]|nr:hypothetical protein C8J56DRAFT_1121616 [Mycena floridula]
MYLSAITTMSFEFSIKVYNRSSSTIQKDAALDVGWKLLVQSWRSPESKKVDPKHVDSNTYELSSAPPYIPWNAHDIKEWGSPVEPDEIFALKDLEEFESTDLSHLLPENSKQLYLLPIDEFIPTPHNILPKQVWLEVKISPKISPYTSIPIPIPPNDASVLNPPAFTRQTWIIPIRGNIPWEHCTPAVVLDPSTETDPMRTNSSGLQPITWTQACLLEFWTFLLDLAKESSFGPIGISFHEAYLCDVEATETEAPKPVGLNYIDHFRIYHEAVVSMHLRNIFDLWDFDTLASAHLYHAEFGRSKNWKSTGLKGNLVFGTTCGSGIENLRFQLYDQSNERLLWRFEVPLELHYRLDRPFFHVFHGQSRMWGFSFEKDEEAAHFFHEVTLYLNTNAKLKPRRTLGIWKTGSRVVDEASNVALP